MKPRKYKKTGNPIGRPLIKLEDFPPDWKEQLLRMGSEGEFDVNARCYLNISNDTFYKLMDNEPDFLEIVQRMRELSHQWWIKLPIQSFRKGDSKNMNSQLYSLMMRNRFYEDWNRAEQKVDITTQGDKLDSTKKIEIEIIRTRLEDGKE